MTRSKLLAVTVMLAGFASGSALAQQGTAPAPPAASDQARMTDGMMAQPPHSHAHMMADCAAMKSQMKPGVRLTPGMTNTMQHCNKMAAPKPKTPSPG